MSHLKEWKWQPNMKEGKKSASDLALEFKIIQEQILDTKNPEVLSELIKERDKILKEYKKKVKK